MAKRSEETRPPKRWWRDYKTPAGRSPVKDFLDGLTDEDHASVTAAMADVASGEDEGKHLRGDIYEVVADGNKQTFRILFSREGATSRVLLALHGFSKKTQKTPPQFIDTAEKRLKDWRKRGKK